MKSAAYTDRWVPAGATGNASPDFHHRAEHALGWDLVALASAYLMLW